MDRANFEARNGGIDTPNCERVLGTTITDPETGLKAQITQVENRLTATLKSQEAEEPEGW